MPAITVDDLTVLRRIKAPGLGDQPRPVLSVTTAPQAGQSRMETSIALFSPLTYLTSRTSTSNTNVASGGMPGGTPLSP